MTDSRSSHGARSAASSVLVEGCQATASGPAVVPRTEWTRDRRAGDEHVRTRRRQIPVSTAIFWRLSVTTSHPRAGGVLTSIVTSMSVCLCVCLSVCVLVTRVSLTAEKNSEWNAVFSQTRVGSRDCVLDWGTYGVAAKNWHRFCTL